MLSGLAAGDDGTGITRGNGTPGGVALIDGFPGTCSIAQGLAVATQTIWRSVKGWQLSIFVVARRQAAVGTPTNPAACDHAAIARFCPSASVVPVCGPLDTDGRQTRTAACVAVLSPVLIATTK